MSPEEIRIREGKCRTAFQWMTAGYMAFSAVLAAFYAAADNIYLMAQSMGTIAALGAIFGLIRLLKIRPVYSFYVLIVGFTFIAYTLGVACAFYKRVWGYDKLLHGLSGTLTMMLALPLFLSLRTGHRMERADCALATVFCLTTSVAVAGLWEIAEYALSLIAGIDPQCVAATGVADTMQDMIVCTAGALAAVPALVRLYKTGSGGWLYFPAQAFAAVNPDMTNQRDNEEGQRNDQPV